MITHDPMSEAESSGRTSGPRFTRRQAIAAAVGGTALIGASAGEASAAESPWADSDGDGLLEASSHVGIEVGRVDGDRATLDSTPSESGTSSFGNVLWAPPGKLQDAIDAVTGWGDKRGAVALYPHTPYKPSGEIHVKPYVSLFGNNASLRAQVDENVLFFDKGTTLQGPLRVNTRVYDGYTSSAVVLDGSRVDGDYYRHSTGNAAILDGPLRLYGTKGEGTGFHMVANGDPVTHCAATLWIRGYQDAVLAQANGSFLNDNMLDVEIAKCHTGIRHTGDRQAKLLVWGHLQTGTMHNGIVNDAQNPDERLKSVRFWGHIEDPHRVDGHVVAGDRIRVRGTSRFNYQNQNFDLGNGTTLEGVGVERADADGPTRKFNNPGDVVMFEDTGTEDSAATGIYLKLLDNTFVKLSDWTATQAI
jgi:hypothetical protein